MNTGKKRRFSIGLVLLVFAVLMYLFRFEALFAFQRMRLREMGCHIQYAETTAPVNDCGKFWVHRADSYERLTKLSHYFSGLEADLVFDKLSKRFRVYHPPAPPGNLFADSYFQFISSSGNRLWLDIKDIDSTEFDDAIRVFQESDKRYALKKNVIIESSELDFVNRLAKLGFLVSYMASPWHLDRGDLYEKQAAARLAPEVRFVSQEDIYVDSLKKIFPQKKIITWAIAFKNYLDLTHYKNLLADTSISVVLINVKSSYYK